MTTQCECMDGPNEPDPGCLYCGGTGEFVSDERLAELIERYGYLVGNADTIGRRDFKTSDAQHVAIFKSLQAARADETLRVRINIGKGPTGEDVYEMIEELRSGAKADHLPMPLRDLLMDASECLLHVTTEKHSTQVRAVAAEAEARAYREALDDLQQAEHEYREMHDRHGDGSQAAGRAWDRLRRCGVNARRALAAKER